MASLSSLLQLFLILSITTITYTESVQLRKKAIGVNYGFNGDSLPIPIKAVNLYQEYGIMKMRIFEPNQAMLEALRNSSIQLSLGTRNEDIPVLASNQEAAEKWFEANVLPYVNDVNIFVITVGNEVVPGQFSESIVPAMQNLVKVIQSHGIKGMRVSTVVHGQVLNNTYPPSASVFTDASKPFMTGILQHLSSTRTPLFINVYPYFAYASNPAQIRLDYAQFTATGPPVVTDGTLTYMNMFEAMVDGFIWAMEKINITNVQVLVSETGWPHAGNGNITTPELARVYNKNLMHYILTTKGTPKRKGSIVGGFIFSMIDENRKPEGVEQNFGVFKPSLDPNYDLFTY